MIFEKDRGATFVYAPMLIPAGGMMFGILACGLAGASSIAAFCAAGLVVALLIINIFRRIPSDYFGIFIFITFASAGYLYGYCRCPDYSLPEAGTVRFRATVESATQTTTYMRIVASIDEGETADGRMEPTKGAKALLYYSGDDVRPGMSISFPNKLRRLDSSIPMFDAERYVSAQQRRGILYTGYFREEELECEGNAAGISAFFARCRDGATRFIHSSRLQPSTKSFIAAVTTGERDMLSSEQKRLFSQSALAHLLALSGLHIGILAMLLAGVLLPVNLVINYKWRFVLVLLVLWLFVAFTGFSPSATRACIMASVYYLSLILERPHSWINSLAVAAFVILLINPWTLFDAGFQLSFASVVSILLFGGILNPFDRRRQPRLYKIAAIVLTTFTATLGAWAITAYHFGSLPLFSLPFNFIAVPLMAPYLFVAIGYYILFALGFDSEVLRAILDGSLRMLNELMNAFTPPTIDFSPNGLTVVLWLAGLFLLGRAFYSKRQLTRRYVASGLLLVAAIAASRLYSVAPEEGTIINTSEGVVTVKSRIGGKDYDENFGRGVEGFVKSAAGHIEIVQNKVSRLSEAQLGRLEGADVIVIAGSFKGGISSMPGLGKRRPVILLGPHLRKEERNRIVKEAESLSLRWHDLRQSPMKLIAQ